MGDRSSHIPNERPIGLCTPAHGAPVLFVPFLEKENAEESWFDDIRWYLEYPGETPAEVWMLAQLPGARIGVGAASHAGFAAMAAVKPGLTLDHRQPPALHQERRRIELAHRRRAADFGLAVAPQAVADGLRSGITEADVVQIIAKKRDDSA